MTLVLATVGTDHHHFNRLASWAGRLAVSQPDLHVVLQHGVTRPPEGVEAHVMLGPEALRSMLARADAVVTHGGPGSIMDARAAGHVPVVVPRERQRGEHVDDHQVRFSTRLAKLGEVRLAQDESAFRWELAQALNVGRDESICENDLARVAESVGYFDRLVQQVLEGRGGPP